MGWIARTTLGEPVDEQGRESGEPCCAGDDGQKPQVGEILGDFPMGGMWGVGVRVRLSHGDTRCVLTRRTCWLRIFAPPMTKYCYPSKRADFFNLSRTRVRAPPRHFEVIRTLVKEHQESDHGCIKATMPRDPLIGLVGKPSSGKSTTLNRYATLSSHARRFSNSFSIKSSLTDASSKVGKSTVLLGQISTDI